MLAHREVPATAGRSQGKLGLLGGLEGQGKSRGL